MTIMRLILSTLVIFVALAIHSTVAITCYDCSDLPTSGCSKCQQPDSCNSTVQCSPCWYNASTPTCEDPTTCTRMVTVQPNPYTGGTYKLAFSTCGSTQISQSQSNSTTTMTGCYSSTTTQWMSGVGSFTTSSTFCYCNSDKCNTACSCGADAPMPPGMSTTKKPNVTCASVRHLSGGLVAVLMLSVFVSVLSQKI